MSKRSELTAKQLNDAIDDSNFPNPVLHQQSLGHLKRTLVSVAPASTSPPHGNERVEDGKDSNGITSYRSSTTCIPEQQHKQVAEDERESLSSRRKNHPKHFDLEFGGVGGDNEKIFNVPGTPQTPRTSTTPGETDR